MRPPPRQGTSDVMARPKELTDKQIRLLAAMPAIAGLICLLVGCGIADTPHTVGAVSDDSCNECHREGEYGAKAIDHPDREHCVSCHQVIDYRPAPHSFELSNCVDCHAEGAADAPKTSHPDRPNCERCHASSK